MATNPFEQQKPIAGVRHIIAMSSGKGGVGKSTIAANIAVSLSRLGADVGLLDADIYGPSIPRMFGTLAQKPEIDGDKKILPIERAKVKLMSIGYLIEEELAVAWRGPMLFKAMEQFLREVQWGNLDFLLIDLPPGTGDVQLSLAQKVPISGAVVISTPQDIALADVKRAVDMWKRVAVPLVGVVENMSWYNPPGSTEKIQLFPKGSLHQWLQETHLEQLGEIPFDPKVALASEAGIPFTQNDADSPAARAFDKIARTILTRYT